MNYKIVQIGVEYDYTEYECGIMAMVNSQFSYQLSLNRRLRGIRRFLFKLHTSSKTNKLFSLPFKSVWAKQAFVNKINIKKEDTVCFVYQGGAFYFDIGVFRYLRKKFPKSIFIYKYNDLVELNEKLYPNFLNRCKSIFDVVCTYNPLDSEKYNLLLVPPIIFSSQMFKNDKSPDTDIFYVGRDKGRLEDILKIYEQCKEHFLKCDFYIFGVEKKNQKFAESIHYNHYLPYKDVLEKVKSSRCVLNIVQDNSNGLTMRDFESISNGKLLLTNNHYIGGTQFFDPEKVFFSDSVIPFEKIRNYKDSEWNISGDFSEKAYFVWLDSLIKSIVNKRYEK